jgi:hypothetical protein
MSKKLYMLHIPKCGGLSISLIKKILEKHNITHYPTQHYDKFTDFPDYSYIHWHFGKTPVDLEDVDTVCVVRDPVDRSISNFLWLKSQKTLNDSSFYNDDEFSLVDQLKNYLFNDDFYATHRNLQSTFLSNGVPDYDLQAIYKKNFSAQYSEEEQQRLTNLFNPVIRMKDWYIPNTNTSFENAKATIDKCLHIQTLENHNVLLNNIFDWFLDNFGVNLKDDYEDMYSVVLETLDIPYFNYSRTNDANGEPYTTSRMRSLLSDEEIDEIYNLNSIDKQIYDYVKDNPK